MTQAENAAQTPFLHTIESWEERQRVLQKFIGEQLIVGEDCGTIPGTNNRRVLFKPGAEKVLNFMGLAASLEITARLEDWEKGFVCYEVKVTLVEKRTGVAVADGLGNCNSKERKYKNQEAANVANTILKMAKKRALIDATLIASGAGGMLEGEGERESDGERAPQGNAATREKYSRDSRYANNKSQNAPRENVQTSGNGAPDISDEQIRIIESLAKKIWPVGTERALTDFAQRDLSSFNRVQAQELITKLRAEPQRVA